MTGKLFHYDKLRAGKFVINFYSATVTITHTNYYIQVERKIIMVEKCKSCK